MSGALEIRTCRHEEVPVIEAAMRSPGRSQFHLRRFTEQRSGASEYLIAWLDGKPVGHLNLRWSSHEEPVLRLLGSFPEINALGVWPPELRSLGLGRALVAEAEARARARGADRIGLAVGLENHRARALYVTLGFLEWFAGSLTDSWFWIDDDGVEHEDSEVCTYMVKDLT